jgi:hypothetical protein
LGMGRGSISTGKMATNRLRQIIWSMRYPRARIHGTSATRPVKWTVCAPHVAPWACYGCHCSQRPQDGASRQASTRNLHFMSYQSARRLRKLCDFRGGK